MKKQLASYFSFSKKELNGILVLFILLGLILVFPFFYKFFDKPETYDLSRFETEVALFKASAIKRSRDNPLRKKIESDRFKPEYFTFDPNTLSSSGWKRLGLSSGQIKVVENYLARGGKFFRKEDMKKIYSISEVQYNELEPYISIAPKSVLSDQSQFPASASKFIKGKAVPLVIDLNTADSSTLDRLPGIGPAFAKRIIRFRDKLGGFHDKAQLKDVYGMDSLRYSQFHHQLVVDGSLIKKININSATFDQLKNYPYLNYKQINALIQYRRQHGNYLSTEDLKKVLVLNEEIIRKIGPYLSFDP